MKSLFVCAVLAILAAPGAVESAAADTVDAPSAIASTTLGAQVREIQGAISTNGITMATGREAPRSLSADLPGGKALIAVLEAGSKVSFNLTLPSGSRLEGQPDGAIVVTSAAYPSVTAQAIIATPWAKDANGKSLVTSYEIHGSQLTQHIDTRGATYPIVADPAIQGWGWYGLQTPVVYIQWTKSETRTLNNQVAANGVAAGAAAACSKVPYAPAVIGCAAVVAYKYSEFKNAVATATSKNICLKARIPYYITPTGYPEAISALWFYDHTC